MDPKVKAFDEILKLWDARHKDSSRWATFAKIGAVLYIYQLPKQEPVAHEQANLSTPIGYQPDHTSVHVEGKV